MRLQVRTDVLDGFDEAGAHTALVSASRVWIDIGINLSPFSFWEEKQLRFALLGTTGTCRRPTAVPRPLPLECTRSLLIEQGSYICIMCGAGMYLGFEGLVDKCESFLTALAFLITCLLPTV